MVQRAAVSAAILLAAIAGVAGCASGQETRQQGQSRLGEEERGFHLPFFGSRDNNSNASDRVGPQIGVNSFLWRASLDTLSFMPLASEDPFGGIIITDWYSDPAHPNERFKATVYILDTRLRADALNVSIFRQVNSGGVWQDAAANPGTATQIEDAILRRARELRLSSLDND